MTDIAFKNNNDIAILSCSKDGYLYQHVFKDAKRPIERVNQVSIDISVSGDIARAVSDEFVRGKILLFIHITIGIIFEIFLLSASRRSGNSTAKFTSVFRKNNDKIEDFSNAHSSVEIFVPSKDLQDASMEWFVECAKKYRISGGSIEEMSNHNAVVSVELGRYHV